MYGSDVNFNVAGVPDVGEILPAGQTAKYNIISDWEYPVLLDSDADP